MINENEKLISEIFEELNRAQRHGIIFESAHEAYAVILEELDEFWDICKMKRKDRNSKEIHKELIQLAAMAIKAIKSIPNMVGGSV